MVLPGDARAVRDERRGPCDRRPRFTPATWTAASGTTADRQVTMVAIPYRWTRLSGGHHGTPAVDRHCRAADHGRLRMVGEPGVRQHTNPGAHRRRLDHAGFGRG